jgi:flavin reductase (DIM6/NTAB) family NADH-FMN oxidoreductase RutF
MQHHDGTNAVQRMAAKNGESCGPACTFRDAGLNECFPSTSLQNTLDSLPDPIVDNGNNEEKRCKRPPAVDSSPVQMHCRLITEVSLPFITGDTKTMILLQVDTYVIHRSVLRSQTTLYPNPISIQGNPDVRKITAKIDCLLLSPLASLGCGKFGTVRRIYHMGRPKTKIHPTHGDGDKLDEETCNRLSWEDGARWEIDQLVPADSNDNVDLRYNNPNEDPVTYTYRIDHHCPLGYNPMKQVVCPRFIGWISTFKPDSLKKNESQPSSNEMPTAHISPYSFFMDISRGSKPMVAFAACPRSDEFEDSDDEMDNAQNTPSNNWKDAQRDAEQTGCFCVNFVSQELAWAMNASAAPLGKGLSEFRLMESSDGDKATTPTYSHAPSIHAPMVNESPVVIECKYVDTTKIPDIFANDSMYSLIIGEVVNFHVQNICLKSKLDHDSNLNQRNGLIELDVTKAKPVARLGYGQEYAVIDEYLH